MHKIMTRAAETALAAGVAGGALLLGAAVAGAQEAEPPTTASGDGVLAGNAVNADVDAPVTLCGVAASLLGAATGSCDAPPAPPAAAVPDTAVAQASGDGVGTGNAVGLDVDAPITICGVGVVGAGVASGSCGGGPAPAPAPAAAAEGGGGTGDTTVAQAQGNGVLAGNAIGLDVDVPITVCGVGGALLGAATGNCTLPPPAGGPGGDTAVAQAQGNGLLSGNAIGLNVDLPINICGIGLAVGGLAIGDCAMPAGSALAATAGSTTTATASGNGFLTGNAIAVDLDAPIGVCGVGVAGLGVATGTCHVGPPPCGHHCPPPPCGHECPPPPPCEHHCPPPPPRPPRCDDGCPPPPPPAEEPARREDARPVVHRTALRSGASFRGELPRTGAATGAALPLGTGLVVAGLAFLAAARRRAARVGHPGR